MHSSDRAARIRQRQDQVRRMAAEGLRPNAIAVKLGVSIWTIHADAKAAHVRLFGTPARALSTDEIRRRIAAGETVGAIAASSQITRQAIYKRLARAGSE